MRRHPRIGYRLLADSPNRFIQTSATIALCHHEHYDGSGYPDGLAGEEIPLAARIVTVADVFDALISPRPYKNAWTIEAALKYLDEQRGQLFDPACVDVLLRERERLNPICERTSVPALKPALE
jgi:two-component system response regulator RpfG